MHLSYLNLAFLFDKWSRVFNSDEVNLAARNNNNSTIIHGMTQSISLKWYVQPVLFIKEFIKECTCKYLGFTFSDSKSDDCDICYDKGDYCMPSLTNCYWHLVIVRRMLRLHYFKVIAQHCIVLICEMITKNQHLAKFVLL